ncbi:helix-turn-helix transcriptional regulator [Phascolarctobacterium faecium]|uniref:helix-turn-helix transcriptional regulator n=1 Tax=Phascolarctobacterium faecium TaxID=33025 RepID=UPI0026671434|nr:WYL domain-containing protein [Phascolarctobacterium faecium]
MQSTDKVTRILMLYQELLNGNIVKKATFVLEHQITERTFERDIDDIRLFLTEFYETKELIYDQLNDGYKFIGNQEKVFTEFEFLIIAKILFGSRALRKDEMIETVNTLKDELPKYNQDRVKHLLDNEIFHYHSPSHNKAIIKMCWDLGQCILRKVIIEMTYEKQDKRLIKRLVFPEAVIFSDYYFYLIASLAEEQYKYPAFYRVDRIKEFRIIEHVNIVRNIDIGEMRKKLRKMYSGNLCKVRVKCNETVVEPMLDCFPDAKVINKVANCVFVEAEVFDIGFVKWAVSQLDDIEVLEPQNIRQIIKEKIAAVYKKYQ